MDRVKTEMDNDLFFIEVPEITKVKVKKLAEDAILPTRGSQEAAGWDLYNNDQDYVIHAGETVKINTNISVALPKNTFGAIFARSGLATKSGLAPANKCGVIDSDYRGGLVVALHNHSQHAATVAKGERIAQLVVIPYLPVEFETVDELDETERGTGGFGSSGKM